jgi:hypothetical protein
LVRFVCLEYFNRVNLFRRITKLDVAHTFGKSSTRTSSTSNPAVSATFSIVTGETVVVLLLKIVGATDRTGGAPAFAGQTMQQAGTTQKAAAAPEAGCELWYLLNPPVGSWTVSIPNAGSLTIFYTLATGKAKLGGKSAFDVATGTNGTSTNPAPGSVVTSEDGAIGFAVIASGATTWAPSAQVGTVIANTDDGAHGGGEQYHLQATAGAVNLGWTFNTSDDWGAVCVYFKEVPPHALNNYLTVRADSGLSVFLN